ncbi:hypothetical protein [Mesomycoplasma molare]|uniref:Uncharacterized protein n=1 Tax=Mesomycoplasma molare TaxID=171288 RepID=A0ABY5TXI3_9BACT|nr:hypothetical protein [Mesomycoplasma molare]UWD34236.1 hypothetical protein NX772_00170 [Mesomycoplasma molare]
MKYKKGKIEFLIQSKIFWALILLTNMLLLVFSFLNIKGLTTIYSYTIGFLFGSLSYSYFLFILILCLTKIISPKILETKKIKVDLYLISLFFIFINMFVIFIIEDVIKMKGQNILDIGFKNFKNLKNIYWIELINKTNDPLLLDLSHLGFLNIFIYITLKSFTSSLGSFMIPLLLFLIYLIWKILFFEKNQLIRPKNKIKKEKILEFKKNKIKENKKELVQNIVTNFDLEDKGNIVTKDLKKPVDLEIKTFIEEENTENKSIEETLPFDNPFD